MNRSHGFALLSLVLAQACAGASSRGAAPAPAQAAGPARPRPYPVIETAAFREAVERGTRTRTGRPGPGYWTNTASYRLEAELAPATNLLTGRAGIRYQNNSPDTLRQIFLHLHQNLFAPDAMRNDLVTPTTGMQLTRIAARGREVPRAAGGAANAPGWTRLGTIMRIGLGNEPLLPGSSVDLEFAWSYTVNDENGPRGGTDGQVWYIAYWYPQMAVYDDSRRWQTDQYMGNSEFYMGYADYDVAITVPQGFLVTATGILQNGPEVLSAQSQQRLAEARRTGRIVNIVTEADRAAGRSTQTHAGGRLTWRYRAANVRDFAFGTSDRYLWDATIASPGDHDGDGRADTTDIHTFWRPERRAWAWNNSARYTRHSIDFLSRFLWPYPYPHMTAVDGVTGCSGMEYPMMTCIGGRRDTLTLYSVTVHETAHMWFPMQVGSDEKRFAWQDEGLTRFNQVQAMREFFNGYDFLAASVRPGYLNVVRSGDEVELMRHGDLYPVGTAAYGQASYSKMALNMHALRGLLGDSLFMAAYREYGRRWINKHPAPFDFFNTFNDVTGRDLSWFWRTWWYETWPLDQAIGGVTPRGGALDVVIEDRGMAPMPVRLAVTRQGGAVETLEHPVDAFLAGATRVTMTVPNGATVTRIEIDPDNNFPDVDRTNQVWNREPRTENR